MRKREFIPIPRGQVRSAGSGEFHWVATEKNPSFELVSNEGKYPEGWVEVEFDLRGQTGLAFMPCIYVNHGRSEIGASRVRLPDPLDGRVRAIVRFPKPVRALKLVPLNQLGDFSLGNVQIRELSSLEAGLRLALPYAKPLLRRPSQLPSAVRELGEIWHEEGLLGIKKRIAGELSLPPQLPYREWIERYDTLNDWDRQQIQIRLKKFANPPTIAILLPLRNGSKEALSHSIRSIQSQLYPKWQLCIAGDVSAKARVGEALERELAGDNRVRTSFDEGNNQLANALNSALELSQGDFVAVMREGDRLREHALYMLVEEIESFPDAKLIYTDEDKVKETGERDEHDFKPDWNAELFYSLNYLSHLTAINAPLIEKAGGFRNAHEGHEEYDLLLRCVSNCATQSIRHIPHVLYSRGSDLEEASQAPVSLLTEYWQRSNPGIEVQPGLITGSCHTQYPIPVPAPLVSILIPTKDRLDLLRRGIESIAGNTDYKAFEIIIIDNQSSDPNLLSYLEQLQQTGRARVLKYDRRFNYSAVNNLGAREARGDLLAFLNNDLEVISTSWLSEMVSLAMREDVGAVGALLYYPHNRVQHAGVVLGLKQFVDHIYRGLPRGDGGYHGRARLVQEVSAVTGACLVIRRASFERVSGFDESLPVAFNDIDLCLRLRQLGLRNVFTPYAELYHHESASRGTDDSEEKQERLRKDVEIMVDRWGRALVEDPYFNVNLSLEHVYPTLARPPRVTWPWQIFDKPSA